MQPGKINVPGAVFGIPGMIASRNTGGKVNIPDFGISERVDSGIDAINRGSRAVEDKTKKFLMDFVKGNVGRIPIVDATGEVQQAAESQEAANMGLFGINPNQYNYFK